MELTYETMAWSAGGMILGAIFLILWNLCMYEEDGNEGE